MSEALPLEIHKSSIAPGEDEVVKIPVGQLPSGNPIRIEAHVFRAEAPGPALLVMAGIHGDEINGVEIVRRALQNGRFAELQKGSVVAIPLVNVYGFVNRSREVPDGKDINRSFPGSSRGSLASRLANALAKKVLPGVDIILDYHTGGANLYNYPQIRYSKGDERSEELAKVFGAPFSVAKAPIQKSFRKIALEYGKPALIFEGGESQRYDAASIEYGLAGLDRLLSYLGMVPGEATGQPYLRQHFSHQSWVRSPKAGLFLWEKSSGDQVEKGEEIGWINDPYGSKDSKAVKASHTGCIIGHSNAAVVNQGDALFHIAYE
ncbi:succinylglutamate desuccinylase/aspartoacylase family protein [Phaeodactylibacter xiamenensis]|uniref:succinylglutamate desuccinylase/aspartoacylase family protein n=1 Tax=Phaeodactylibacter xiamenensis TaxID=1524460 RepID=UPI0024A9B147|nr:succinylglutamate desuccinylase/aspartoacylase family protein [Phaeodactylibacter xiamenensis]